MSYRSFRAFLYGVAAVVIAGAGYGFLVGSTQSGLEVNQKPVPTEVPTISSPPVTGLPSGSSGINGLHYMDCPYCHKPYLAKTSGFFVKHEFVRFQVSETEDYETCVLAIVTALRRVSSGVMKPHIEFPK